MLLERNEGVMRQSYEVWQLLISVVRSHATTKFAVGLEAHIAPMLAACHPTYRAAASSDTNGYDVTHQTLRLSNDCSDDEEELETRF